jgi:hypothetical protein
MLARGYETFLKTSDKPTLIVVDSHIGYGSPHKQDSYQAHGEPLGEAEVKLVKENYEWPENAKFLVPDGAYQHFNDGIGKRGGERRLEPAVDLDGVDEGDTPGEPGCQHAEPGADLEHDVIGLQGHEPPGDVEHVVVDQEVLAEVAVGANPELAHPRQRHLRAAHRRKPRVALASICPSSTAGSTPRWPARASSVRIT